MKLKLKTNSMREPPGGHQFYEAGVIIEGERFTDLVKKLTSFRIDNGIPLGNPDQEILVRYAEKWPYLVENDLSTMPDIAEQGNTPRWKAWVLSLWKNPPKSLITMKEATDRWDVCEYCKYNKNIRPSSTGEDAEITKRAFLLRRGQAVPKGIHFCTLHGMDLGVGCLLENPATLSSAKPGETYEKCWMQQKEPNVH